MLKVTSDYPPGTLKPTSTYRGYAEVGSCQLQRTGGILNGEGGGGYNQIGTPVLSGASPQNTIIIWLISRGFDVRPAVREKCDHICLFGL